MAMDSSAIWFNAHHAPVGAFASLTLGYPGAKGGLGLELGGPANESVFVGIENASGEGYQALPFFASSADSARRYDVSADEPLRQGRVQPFPSDQIRRDFGAACDTWSAGDLTFSIFSPVKSVPDPAKAGRAELMRAVVPAVFAEIRVDNTRSSRARKVFFGYEGGNPFYNTRRLDDVAKGKFCGVGQGPVTAIVSDSAGMQSGCGFTLDAILEPDFVENLAFGLGGVGALFAMVPARKKAVYRFAICFHRDGTVTSGMATKYFYTRYFPAIEDVARYALANFDEQKSLAVEFDKTISRAALGDARAFQLRQAIRSYVGATEFLVTKEGRPFWTVNEGEYRMLNTFDLTVDHLYFEMEMNPWAVRDQLDWFVDRYSYRDKVRLPGDPTKYAGGISFCHDMGIGNCLSRPGHSSYEKFGIHGCFSHMTHEQLVNWVCCATTYVLKTGDVRWRKANLRIFRECLKSLVNRDHPDAKQRDGVMSADSSRCLGGSEITTYDSLDASLGQARNNLYLAVKTWAAYVGLRAVLSDAGSDADASLAASQAVLCAGTLSRNLNDEGFIPAVMGEGNASRIIPAIEGLVFPILWGMKDLLGKGGEFFALRQTLETHLRSVLVPGVCKFPDGGWKLSSTNGNSWLSKIYLCQFVAAALFGIKDTAADDAHAGWLLDPENSYFAWSDQMVEGKAKGSKYYPRGVTSWLWLRKIR